MSNKAKKQSFLGGAVVLAVAVVISKVLGAVYKLPLGNILGSEGYAHYNIAFNIYNVLLTFSTAGLPLAISKLSSEAHALGRENEKRKLFRTAIWLFFALGLIGSLLMYFGAVQLSHFMNDPDAFLSIRALSPAVFCVCLLACMRGYTQGQGNMTPTATSQNLESIVKLVVGLSLAWYLIDMGKSLDVGAAGAIFGITVSEIVAVVYLSFYMLRNWDTTRCDDVPPSSKTLMRHVLAIGIPITLSNSAMSIITLIDSKIVLGRLDSISSLLSDKPTVLYGQYTFSMNLFNLPPSFIFPVTMSLIPFAAAAMARQDRAGADRIISSAFRLIALLALPAGIGLSVLARPILLTLYPAQQTDAIAAGPHLQVLGIACIFVCLMLLTNAILQAYGHERTPIYTMIAGGVTKISMNYVLVGNPDINIHGAPVSTLCCYLVIAGLNLFFVWKYSPQKPRYFSLFFKPTVASVLMGVATWAFYGISYRVLAGHLSSYGATAVAMLLAVCVGVVIYFILVLALQILRADDLSSLPHGKKLAKILRLK